MFETILNFIKENVYLLTFFFTVVDHSGIPIPIISAGLLDYIGNVNFIFMLIIINLALILVDMLLILLGIYLRRKFLNEKMYFSVFYRIYQKFMNLGDRLIRYESISFYLFGKFLPQIGKFLPVFIGYQNNINLKNLMFLFIGNNIYIVIFYYLGVFFGNSILEYRFLGSAICIGVFLTIFIIMKKFAVKKSNV